MTVLKFNDSVFDQFPVLKTERLILREIIPSDADIIFKNYSDQEVMKYFGRELYKDISEAEKKILDTGTDFREKNGIRWAVCFRENNVMIGSGGIWRIQKDHLRGEIGYELSKEFWGNGIMTEALKEIVKFGFEKMNLHSIEANLDPENTGSVRLLEKLGFIREGYFAESYYFNGKFTDTGTYSLLNKDHE